MSTNHYSEGLETQNFGPDNDPEEIGGFINTKLNDAARTLLAVFQSLPETRHKLDYNRQFITHWYFYSDQTPGRSTVSSGSPGNFIRIDPLPHGVPKQKLLEQALEALNPEQYAANVAIRTGWQKDHVRIAGERDVKNETWRQGQLAIRETDPEHSPDYAARNALVADEEQSLRELNWKLSRFNMKRARHHETIYDGFDPDAVAAKMLELTPAYYAAAAKSYTDLLDGVEIAYRVISHQDGSASVELDQRQPDFREKVTALMEKHRDAVLKRWSKADFIIAKPDGTALDPAQAAQAIRHRRDGLDRETAHLDAIATKYGVLDQSRVEPLQQYSDRIMAALNSQISYVHGSDGNQVPFFRGERVKVDPYAPAGEEVDESLPLGQGNMLDITFCYEGKHAMRESIERAVKRLDGAGIAHTLLPGGAEQGREAARGIAVDLEQEGLAAKLVALEAGQGRER